MPIMSEHNTAAWLALTMLSGLSRRHLKKLLDAFEDGIGILNADPEQIAQVSNISLQQAQNLSQLVNSAAFKNESQLLTQHNVIALDFQHPHYPQQLLSIPSIPLVLYMRGVLPSAAHQPWIAIVGTRQNSEYGARVVRQLITEIATYAPQAVIVSGLAVGIDTLAHQQALACRLQTIAVLGNGFNRIYPAENAGLAKQIEAQGALLTEFSHHQPPRSYHFPKRNRIICGLCDAVVLVEARAKSGALITAEWAKKYQKPLFAVPGSLEQPASAGVNALLQAQGASMALCGKDILDGIGWQSAWSAQQSHFISHSSPHLIAHHSNNAEHTDQASLNFPDPHAKMPITVQHMPSELHTQILELLQQGGTAVEMMAEQLHRPVESLLVTLLDLEMDGIIGKNHDGSYVLKARLS